MRPWFWCVWVLMAMPLSAVAQDAAAQAPAPGQAPVPGAPARYAAPPLVSAPYGAAPSAPLVLSPPPASAAPPVVPAPSTLPPPPARIPVPPSYAPGPGPSLGTPTYYLPVPLLPAQPEAAPNREGEVPASVYVIAASHVIPFPTSLEGADLARREQLQGELEAVEKLLDDVEPERVNTGGPIAAMVFGYGSALVSSIVAISTFRRAEDIQRDPSLSNRYDITHNGVVNDADERRYRRLARGFGAGALLGLAVGIVGSVGLSRRRNEREDKRREREQLLSKRDRLRQMLGLALDAGPRNLELGVEGRF